MTNIISAKSLSQNNSQNGSQTSHNYVKNDILHFAEGTRWNKTFSIEVSKINTLFEKNYGIVNEALTTRHCQLYFDIEYYCDYDEYQYIKLFSLHFTKYCHGLQIDTPKFYYVRGSGFDVKKQRNKVSWHVIVRGIGFFNKQDDAINIVKGFRNYLISNDIGFFKQINKLTDELNKFNNSKFDLNGGIDTSVYKSRHQLFRIPFALKDKREFDIYVKGKIYKKNKLIKSKKGIKLISLHLVQYITDNESIDLTKIPIIKDKYINNNKPVKHNQSQQNYIGIFRGSTFHGVANYNIYENFDYSKISTVENLPKYIDSIDFLLNVIPSQDHQAPWSAIAICLKTSGFSVDTFIEWSKGCSNFDEDECKRLWNSIKPRKKGYNYGTLVKLAKRFVNMAYGYDMLNDIGWKTHQCTNLLDLSDLCPDNIAVDYKTVNNVYEYKLYECDVLHYEQKYLFNDKHPNKMLRGFEHIPHNIIYIDARMGGGKSYELRKYIVHLLKNNKNTRILYFSTKIAHADDIMREFQEMNIVLKANNIDRKFIKYSNVNRKTMGNHQLLLCEVESIHYIDTNYYDVVIMDESESICEGLISTIIKKPIETLNTFANLIKKAQKIICADALLYKRTWNLIQNIRGFEPSLIIKNIFKDKPKTIKRIPLDRNSNIDMPEIAEMFIQDVIAGNKCVFVCSHKKICLNVSDYIKTLSGITYKCYTSESDDIEKHSDLSDVNNAWKVDALIYSPTITCGINFTNDWFNKLYILTSLVSCNNRNIAQASRRVRNIKCDEIIVSHYLDAFNVKYNPRVHKQIQEQIYLKKQILDNVDELDCDKFIEDLYIQNTIEDNHNKHKFCHLRYFVKCFNKLNCFVNIDEYPEIYNYDMYLESLKQKNNDNDNENCHTSPFLQPLAYNGEEFEKMNDSEKQKFIDKYILRRRKNFSLVHISFSENFLNKFTIVSKDDYETCKSNINNQMSFFLEKKQAELYEIAQIVGMKLFHKNVYGKDLTYWSTNNILNNVVADMFEKHIGNSQSNLINQIKNFKYDVVDGDINKIKPTPIQISSGLVLYKLIKELYEVLDIKSIADSITIDFKMRRKVIGFYRNIYITRFKQINCNLPKGKQTEDGKVQYAELLYGWTVCKKYIEELLNITFGLSLKESGRINRNIDGSRVRVSKYQIKYPHWAEFIINEHHKQNKYDINDFIEDIKSKKIIIKSGLYTNNTLKVFTKDLFTEYKSRVKLNTMSERRFNKCMTGRFEIVRFRLNGKRSRGPTIILNGGKSQ